MSQLVDRTITALRAEHDTLADLVRTLTDEQLAATGGAAEWTVAQVLSHLGSGAEIGRAPILRATGEDVTAEDNQSIWARWDASTPRAQAEGFLESNARWLELVEAPDNQFMRLAMAGRFTVSGDGYEYLRLTSALHRLADAAREIA